MRVGRGDRLVLGRRTCAPARPGRRSPRAARARRRGRRRARSAGRSSPGRRSLRRRRARCAPLVDARRSTSSATLSRWSSSISGPTSTPSSVPRPTLQRAHPRGEPLGELVRDRLVHVEAVGRGAGLADVAHLGEHRAVDGGVEVGVLEDEERRVAAELHRDPQQLVGGLLDSSPDLGRAGEGQLAQARVVDQRPDRRARRRTT